MTIQQKTFAINSIMLDESNPVMVFAADEWRRYLCAMTGRTHGNTRSASKHGTCEQDLMLAVIGDRVFARLPASIRKLSQRIEHDGFAAGNHKGTVYVVARQSRGVLFGVYDLLEREGGIVFAGPGPGEEFVLRLNRFTVTVPVTVRNPLMDLRVIAPQKGSAAMDRKAFMDWLAKRKFSGGFVVGLSYYKKCRAALLPEIRKRGLTVDVGGHCALDIISPDKYRLSHPRYFAQSASGERVFNNLCYSNPEMRAEMAQQLMAFLDECPEITGLYVWPPDGAPACRCAVCRTRSSGYWTYQTVATMADLIRPRHPRVNLAYVSYDLYTQVPENVRPLPDNVFVQFCEYWDRAQNQPICDYRQGRDALKDEEDRLRNSAQGRHIRNHRQVVEEMAAWRQVTNHLTIASYYSDLHIRRVINTAVPVIRKDMLFYHALGIRGYFDVLCHPDRWLASGLNLFALGEYSWDTRPEPELLIRRFARGMFGPGTEDILVHFYKTLDEMENQPCFLGFNPLDLLHRGPKEVAYFSGVVEQLVAPTRQYFSDRLASMSADVTSLRRKRGLNRRNVLELQKMLRHLRLCWWMHWALYLAFAYAAQGAKHNGMAAIREAEKALRSIRNDSSLDERFYNTSLMDWYKQVIPQLRRRITQKIAVSPVRAKLWVDAEG